MSQAMLVRNLEPTARTARPVLFKRDRPREIDRFINYFGGAGESVADPCGKPLLDAIDCEERVEVGP